MRKNDVRFKLRELDSQDVKNWLKNGGGILN